MGFTPAQLKEAGVTIAEMRSHGLSILQMYNGGVSIADLLSAGLSIAQLRTGSVPDHALFNETCNTPQTSGTAPGPTITLTPATLTATDTQVVLRGVTIGSLVWTFSVIPGSIASFVDRDRVGRTVMLGSSTARFVSKKEDSFVSTLSIPLADVFSNPMVSVTDAQLRTTSIQLCPGS